MHSVECFRRHCTFQEHIRAFLLCEKGGLRKYVFVFQIVTLSLSDSYRTKCDWQLCKELVKDYNFILEMMV